MMKSLLLLPLLAGCTTQQVAPITHTKLSSAQPDVIIAPHYHTVTWPSAYWMDADGSPIKLNIPIEYDVFSTTDGHSKLFEQRTMNTNAFITNDFPQQFYIIGAHSK